MRHSSTLDAYLDGVHRAHYDQDAGTVTFTAHGAGEDIVQVDHTLTRQELISMVKQHEFTCCTWVSLLYYAREQ